MSALTAVGLLGSGFGMWLGSPLLCAAGPSRTDRRLLGVLVVVCACAAALISADHGGYLPPMPWVELLEFTLTLGVGPILLLYVRTAARYQVTSQDIARAMPAVVSLGYVVCAWAFPDLPSVSIRHVVGVQVAYTIATAWVYHRSKVDQNLPRRAASIPAPTFVLMGFVLIHCAQLIRLTLTGSTLVQEAVPLAITGGFLTMGAVAFHRTILSSPPVESAGSERYRRSALRSQAIRGHLTVLDRLIREERVFVDPNVSLAVVAARMNLPPYQVSQLLNQHLHQSFTDWITEHRVREVKIQLLDPRNDVYTIEAVASGAGFKSRAGFYKAFKRALGVTPSSFRRLHRGRH